MGNLFTKTDNAREINRNFVKGINLQYFLNRAKTLLIYGHSYEATREYKDALRCYEEAIDIMQFLCECGLRKEMLVDIIRKEMVFVIRKAIVLRNLIEKHPDQPKPKDLYDTTAKITTRPDLKEALEILIEDLPEDEQEVLLRIKSCVNMQVPKVQWDDIIGLQAAKTAIIEAIVNPTIFKKVLTS